MCGAQAQESHHLSDEATAHGTWSDGLAWAHVARVAGGGRGGSEAAWKSRKGGLGLRFLSSGKRHMKEVSSGRGGAERASLCNKDLARFELS